MSKATAKKKKGGADNGKLKEIKTFKDKNTKWESGEEAFLYACREEGITYRMIAMELGRSSRSCEAKYNNTNWRETRYFDPLKSRMKDSVKNSYRERIIKLQEKRIQTEQVKADILADRIESAVLALPNVPKPIYKHESRKKQQHSPEDVGLILSDAHIGHHHSLEETGGLSEYNVDVFKDRVENLKEATTEIVERHSQIYNLPNLHIFCLGDMVAGMNQVGNWNPTYINTPILDQVFIGFDAIADMIYYWLGLFEGKINFYGLGGNHGRAANKGTEKEYVNWDIVMYKFLEARFKDNERVNFNVPLTWWLMPKIRNHKFLLLHGDDVRAGSYPILSIEKTESKIMGLLREIPDYTLAAHFHSGSELTTNHGRVIINGCFSPSTLVHLSNGTMLPISEISIGDYVIGKDMKVSPVTNIMKKKHSGNMVCFKTSGNVSTIKCTPNHEFFAIKNSMLRDIPLKNTEESAYNPFKSDKQLSQLLPKFIAAENLGFGDYVVISHDSELMEEIPTVELDGKKIFVDEELAQLIGLYLAEGSSSGVMGRNNHSTWSFSSKEQDIAKFAQKVLMDKFNLKSTILVRESKSIAEVVTNNTKFGDFITSFCGKGCANKKLKEEVMKWPINLQKRIIAGYMQGDGHVDKASTRSVFCYMAASVSRSLRDQIFYMARNCGFSCRIREQSPGGRRKRTSYWIYFNGLDAIELAEMVDKKFDKDIYAPPSSLKNVVKCGKYTLAKISQCWTEEYDGDVYDLEVAEQLSYNVQGLVCHNSFIGSDVYSLKSLQKGSKPEQKIFGIHDKQGMTWTYNLNLGCER